MMDFHSLHAPFRCSLIGCLFGILFTESIPSVVVGGIGLGSPLEIGIRIVDRIQTQRKQGIGSIVFAFADLVAGKGQGDTVQSFVEIQMRFRHILRNCLSVYIVKRGVTGMGSSLWAENVHLNDEFIIVAIAIEVMGLVVNVSEYFETNGSEVGDRKWKGEFLADLV